MLSMVTMAATAALLILYPGASGQETTQTIEDCGTGWFLMQRACYKLSTDAMPWESAKKNCEVDGGYLLSVSSVAEMNLIKKEMRQANRRNTWWVGLQRAAPYSKTWVWLDSGSPFSARVTRWSPSEPNNQNGRENCVEITSDGTLSDKDCDEVRPFVCERHETTTTTATTSTTASTPASSSSTVVLEELPSSTLLSSSSTPSSTTTTPAPTTPAPTTSTMTSTEEKKIPKPKPPETLPIENKRTLEDLYKLYSGCYLQEPRVARRTCPSCTRRAPACVHPLKSPRSCGLKPRLASQETMKCRTGQGKAYFQCGGNPVCWRGQPNVDECASPEFKKILDQVKSTNDTQNPPEPKQTVALTTQLADVTESDDLTSDDVMATSKVISGLVTSGATQKLKDESEVEAIVSNVVKAGSNLVSTNKSRVWTDMPQQDKIRSATSLMVAMETATVAMAEKIDKPTVINTKDENIELELRVINITSVSPAEKENIVYNAENSENTFSIPLETLSHLSHGGLAKVVFMTHYTMGDILGDTAGGDKADEGKKPDDTVHTRPGDSSKDAADDVKQETPAPKLASYILSASVGGQGEGRVKLPQPVTFTMKHLKMVPAGWDSLCSFWEISESQMGSWSQEGCRVVRSNASQTTCECDHMTNFAVLMAVQEVKISETHQSFLKLATIVGCVISCICLLASWITFTCFTKCKRTRFLLLAVTLVGVAPSEEVMVEYIAKVVADDRDDGSGNFPGAGVKSPPSATCNPPRRAEFDHKNLVVCLFIAEMLFLTGIDQTQNRVACGFIAGFLHYFFLASFLWMLLEGVHIVLMLVQVFDASRSRLPYYYATAYAPPFLIIAISAGLYHQGYGTERYCWLTTERYFIWSFAGPVAVILFVNAVILVYAMTMVCRHSEYVFSGKDKTAGGIRSWIQGAAALEVLLGLTWILGYFFLNTQTLALAYLFTALNSLQGLFIFCFHCLLNKKARKEYRRVMKVKRRPSTTTGSGTGTHSASLGHKHKHDLSLDAPGGPLFHSHA
ncbi:adhesion G protein-coupled receptor L1-like [Pomacea canaliculata]|uniref:adhesion G protein-coupled receptor L1-like n=1 Tax=Pomacea canaliculata TaxID=400727 RepID=UPI000D728CEF|nr:adhesion G protein-coupled receptor L1-like [Pomacea canaliculata]